MDMHMHVHVHMHMDMHMHVHMHLHTHVHMHMHTRMHVPFWLKLDLQLVPCCAKHSRTTFPVCFLEPIITYHSLIIGFGICLCISLPAL